MAKYLIQIIVLGTQAVGKAFAKAVRQEYQASQAAANARYAGNKRPGSGDSRTIAENLKLGMTLEEARQILNVSSDSSAEEIKKSYDFLFNINDKSKGGSFYLQSKFYRAKERLDKEIKKQQESSQTDPSQQQSSAEKPPDRAERNP